MRRQGLQLGVLAAGMFLVLLDVTVVNVALPDIGRDLDASLPALQWVVDGYAVPLAALLLVGGSLADRLGARRMLATGMAVFLVASIGCALAPDPAVLVVARVVQGVGAAVLLPASQAGVTTSRPDPQERARALGLWAGLASTALPAGPVLGGLLVQWLGWRAVFWLNVPVVLVLLPGVLRLVPGSRTGSGRGLDRAGAVAASVALGAVVLAVTEAGAGEVRVAVAAVLTGVVALGCFIAAGRHAEDPMLPADVLHRPAFVRANLVAAAMNFVGIGTILVLTLLLQSVQGRSSLASGVALVPLFLPLVLLSPVTGRLVARHGVVPPMVGGLLVGAAGSASLVAVGASSAYVVLLPALVGLGAGMGLLTAAVVTAAVQAVPPARGGLAAGATNAARQVGGALGIAVYGAVVGPPAAAGFDGGLHRLGVLGALVWLVAAAVARRVSPRPG